MKRLLLLGILAAVAIVPGARDLSGSENDAETLVGVLSYVPKPDMSICFCGSFRLSVEDMPGEWYLVSDSIDLEAFTGQRVIVSGRGFSGLCSGTLARPCSFFEVRKIVPAARTETETVDWGFVKSIYR